MKQATVVIPILEIPSTMCGVIPVSHLLRIVGPLHVPMPRVHRTLIIRGMLACAQNRCNAKELLQEVSLRPQ